MTGKRIEAKVAEILTGRELVLNKGAQDGVSIGMRFAILNRRGAEIRDPDTSEVLGSVELEKTVVKIVRVHERLSVGRTFRTVRTPGMGIGLALLRSDTVPETLRTDESRVKDELSEAESYVKLGDPAIQIVGEEFED